MTDTTELTAPPTERRTDLATRAILDRVVADVIPVLVADERARDVDAVALLAVVRQTVLATLRALEPG